VGIVNQKYNSGRNVINMFMSNIIKFPGSRTEPVEQEISDFYEEQLIKAFIEDFVDRVGHGLVTEFFNNGYDVDDEEFILRYMYSLEVMKSVLYSSKGIEHKLSARVDTQAKQYFNEEVNETNE